MNSGLKALSHSGGFVLYNTHPFHEGFAANQDSPADPHDGQRRQVGNLAIDDVGHVRLRATQRVGYFGESEYRRHGKNGQEPKLPPGSSG